MCTKTPKPRVMWAIYDSGHDPIVCGNRSLIRICEQRTGCHAIRVAVIPISRPEWIVKRARKAFFSDQSGEGIRAALTAAGIPCRKARKRARPTRRPRRTLN